MCAQKPMLILSVCFFLLCKILAQNFAQNSLYQDLKSANDTVRVNALNTLARQNIPDSLSKAEKWANRALSLAKQTYYTKGIIYAYKNKGLIADYQGKLDRALHYYQEGIKATNNAPQWLQERADLTINMGIAHYYVGDLGQTLKNYLIAEKLLVKTPENPSYAKLINNLAAVYRNLSRYPEAIQTYEKSLALKRLSQDSIGIANTLNNLGLTYAYMDDPGNAVKYFKLAKKSYQTLRLQSEVLSVDISLSVALEALGREAEARPLLNQALFSKGLKVSIHDLIQAKLLYAKILFGEKKYLQAEALLNEIEPTVLNTDFLKNKATYYEWRAKTLNALGKSPEAYLALSQHKLLLDTLVKADKLKLEKDMEAQYLTRDKENQIQIQQLVISRNKRERLVYLFLLLGLSVILLLANRLSRQRKKANALLNEKNQQIQKALDEKEILLKEIHHRVKNNLQIISSLLSLQSRRVEDPKVLEAIQDGQNRVNSMALIHENLYQDDNLIQVDVRDYVQKLCDQLLSSYAIHPGEITVHQNIAPLKLDIDTIIPLGLMLNELISNALKYAFTNQATGRLDLSLQEKANGLVLHVADNGRGLPEAFQPEQLKSMGFRLIQSFTKKLNGVLKVWNAPGAHIEIYIPHHNS
jgi:two-component sensor histidine kinase/tetratricopeptide (TPR) repeat protein